MFIKDGTYRSVDVSGLTAPILEGTVLTSAGAVAAADGSDAFGIVPETVFVMPPTKMVNVVIGGTIDLQDPANANVTISKAVQDALSADINFIPGAGALPPVDSDDNGKILLVEDGKWKAGGDEAIADAVSDWLDDHPEATTTVEDEAVTDAKLAQTGGVLSEVHDVRTGADGTVYESAGAAVRGEVSKRKTDIEASDSLLFEEVEKSFLVSKPANGSITNSWNVAVVNTPEYIPIKQYDTAVIHINRPLDADSGFYAFAYALFDSSKSLIHNYDWTNSENYQKTVFVKNPDAKYIRFTIAEFKADGTSYHVLRKDDFAYGDVVVSVSRKSAIDNAKEFFVNPDVTFNPGYYFGYDGFRHADSGYSLAKVNVALFAGGRVSGITGVAPNAGFGIGFTDANDATITTYTHTTAGTYVYPYDVAIPDNAVYFYISRRNASASEYVPPVFKFDAVDNLQNLMADFKEMQLTYRNNAYLPYLRNGSVGNPSSAYSVCSMNVMPIDFSYDNMEIEFVGDLTKANKYSFTYTLFDGATDDMTTSAARSNASVRKSAVDDAEIFMQSSTKFSMKTAYMRGFDHISVAMWRKLDDTYIPIRIADEPNSIRISYSNDSAGARESANYIIKNLVDNARHVKNGSAIPLTLLHFSDIHADTQALARISKDAEYFGGLIDDIICTGDIVANSYGSISSWWNKKVLTCIGNHDSASYSGGVYNWTALSMADRDTYYIAPFESNWGITHTSGTSYYYKDYLDEDVRLIVMDAMLYNDEGEDTDNQTEWLTELLADAIAKDLHVLIAIHSPHGGAVAEECSFSKLGQGTMPTNGDCNTPQDVIDIVSEKISSGLHFIGYLVGHTHQDNVWDAEDNGKQLMYCVTCANVSNGAQWTSSDQNRSEDSDAYNLVTVDTANTLVKIVRGGGADIDDHMRTRKAICFNYSTGEKVGEVL